MPKGYDEESRESGGMFVFDAKMGPKSSSSRVSKSSQKSGNSNELKELRNRLRMLENSIGKFNPLQTPENTTSDVFSEVTPSQNSLDTVGVDDRVRFLPDASFRGKKGKTRYFGRSHYTTTVSFVSANRKKRELGIKKGNTQLLIETSSKTLGHFCDVVIRMPKMPSIRI